MFEEVQNSKTAEHLKDIYKTNDIQADFPCVTGDLTNNKNCEEYVKEKKEKNWLERVIESIGAIFKAVLKFIWSILEPVFEVIWIVIGPIARFIGKNIEFFGYLALIGLCVFIFYMVKKLRGTGQKIAQKKANGAALTTKTFRGNLSESHYTEYKLSDADALAGEGQYSDATHILLLISIDHIQNKLKGALEISETSREIMVSDLLNDFEQITLNPIVNNVERSLFAGFMLDEDNFNICRMKYLSLKEGE